MSFRAARPGELHPLAKLTWEKVRHIRRLIAENRMTYAAIAARFGVVEATIDGIAQNRAWRVSAKTWEHAKNIRGDRNPRARLTWTDVRRIRRRREAGGVTLAALARAYGVSVSTIDSISRRDTWWPEPGPRAASRE